MGSKTGFLLPAFGPAVAGPPVRTRSDSNRLYRNNHPNEKPRQQKLDAAFLFSLVCRRNHLFIFGYSLFL